MLAQPAYLVYGIARSAALEGLRAIEQQPLSVVRAGALSAVVSVHQPSLFEEADTQSLHAFAASYHRCVNQISADTDVLPMQLGMMLADVEAVRGYLREMQNPLVEQLDRVAGLQEWKLQLRLLEDMSAAAVIVDPKTYLRAKMDARRHIKTARQSKAAMSEALEKHLLAHGAHACRRAVEEDTFYILWPRSADAALLDLLEAQAAHMSHLQLDIHGPEAPFWFVSHESERDAA